MLILFDFLFICITIFANKKGGAMKKIFYILVSITLIAILVLLPVLVLRPGRNYIGNKTYSFVRETNVRETNTYSPDPSWYEIGNQPDEALNIVELWIGKKTYTVNGISKESDVAPVIRNSRTLVPIRVISEGLGAVVNWDGTERKVTIQLETLDGNKTVELFIGKKNYYIDGIMYEMDVPPQIINSRTMVPIRVVSESLNCKVYWDGTERKVTVKAINLQSDADFDSLTFEQEYSYGTDPNSYDTDDDGLSDSTEINGWNVEVNNKTIHYTSNPTKADTDNDGLSDKQEYQYKTNPNNPDTDGDGLSDSTEINGWNVEINNKTIHYTSNPTKADTDNDGLTDGQEKQYKTNPNNPDTDGDGLPDGDEVLVFKTDPLKENDFRMFKQPNAKTAFQEGILFTPDVNCDFKIDDTDYNLVKEHLSSISDYQKKYDVNGDGVINGIDLAIVYQNESDKLLIDEETFNEINKITPLKEDFVKFVWSKQVENGRFINLNGIKAYLTELTSIKADSKDLAWVIDNNFGMEDGVLDKTEKEIISLVLEGKSESINKSLIDNLESEYISKMDAKIPGMGKEVESIATEHTLKEAEAIEDIYGQVMRSKKYSNPADRFNKDKVDIKGEMYDAFTSIKENGNPERENQKRLAKLVKWEKSADNFVLDGKMDDWIKARVEPHTIHYDATESVGPPAAVANQMFVTYDMHNNLWIFIKTQEPPDLNKYVYCINIFQGRPTRFIPNLCLTKQGIATGAFWNYYDSATGEIVQKYYNVKFNKVDFKVGKDGLEIKLSRAYTVNGEPQNIDGNISLMETTNDNNWKAICTLKPNTKIFPGVFFYDEPDQNTQLYLMKQLCETAELKRYDLIGVVLPITESAIYNMIDKESQSILLTQLPLYYNYMNKFEKGDFYLDLNLASFQNLSMWNWFTFSDNNAKPVFSGFYSRLNKYDYWFNFTFPGAVEKLGVIFKSYKNNPGDIEEGMFTLYNSEENNVFISDTFGKQFQVISDIGVNPLMQSLEKYDGNFIYRRCIGQAFFTDAVYQSLGIVPFKLTRVEQIFALHYFPAYYDKSNGKLIISNFERLAEKIWQETTFFVDVPSVNGIQISKRVLIVHQSMKDAQKVFDNGIVIYGDNGLKKKAYELLFPLGI